MRYKRWVAAAREALEILGHPAKIRTIAQVIHQHNLLQHRSKESEQTLRNEIRKSCEGVDHQYGAYPQKYFYEPRRGVYGLVYAEYAQIDGPHPSPSKLAEAQRAAAEDKRRALEKAEASARLRARIVSEDEEAGFLEGVPRYRLHRKLERDLKLAIRAKEHRLQQEGILRCDVCEFCFSEKYGEWAGDFIEADHTVPVSKLSGTIPSRIKDLALVCSNCHRMVHFKRLWLTIPQLRALIKKGAQERSKQQQTGRS
jgi:hypothetical protein